MKDSAIPASPTLDQLNSALARVRSILSVTPLTYSAPLSELVDQQVYLKWDNKFRTGSFKERGAVNALESLPPDERAKGVCTASAGNHALALSYHASRLGIPCSIVMPVQAPLVKVQSTRRTGANVILHGKNLDESYDCALQLAAKEHMTFISPFDDERIIAGQSTCGQELADQVPDADYVIVPVGGGGLISGIALAMKHRKMHAKIIGVQSEWANDARSGKHSSSLIPPVTIADGIAVKRVGKITGPLISALVDNLVTATENQIAEAIARLVEHERSVVEGAGAAGLAALLAGCIPDKGKKIVVLICGSNIDLNVLSRLIDRDMGHHQRLLTVSVSVPDRPGSLAAITKLFAEKSANILEVLHNRSFSQTPGNVEIRFLVEIRDPAHSKQLLEALTSAGIPFTVESR